jgi:ATP-dependent DNA helicase RecQ
MRFTKRDLARVIQENFGLREIRKDQLKPMLSYANGSDFVLLMPTGGGKSLCYQVPMYLRPGVGIVISPLISLINDQMLKLSSRGIPAATINSMQSDEEARQNWEAIRSGSIKFIYVSPERATSEMFASTLAKLQLSGIAIDEAHCISQWGHDFRPSYSQLGEFRSRFPDVPIMAATATATEITRRDIKTSLGLEDANEYIGNLDRANIFYEFHHNKQKRLALEQIVEKHEGQSGIVYCPTRKLTESLKRRYGQRGLQVYFYHAGLEPAERRRVEDQFMTSDCIVFATIAFGMGIDKPDVRFVAHYGFPDSIERFYQESGRAGRDQASSFSYVLGARRDLIEYRYQIRAKDVSDDVKTAMLHKLSEFEAMAYSASCRRKGLLRYFSQPAPDACGNCDVCSGSTLTDTPEQAQKPRVRVPRKLRAGSRPASSDTGGTDPRALYCTPLWVMGLKHYEADAAHKRGLLKAKQAVTLFHESDNSYDKNAVVVSLERSGQKLGYLPRSVAQRIAPALDFGWLIRGEICEIRTDSNGVEVAVTLGGG